MAQLAVVAEVARAALVVQSFRLVYKMTDADSHSESFSTTRQAAGVAVVVKKRKADLGLGMGRMENGF
jgi:hypothetical protein